MPDPIGRRAFLFAVTTGALAAAGRGFAQARVPRIGLVSGGRPDTFQAFLQGSATRLRARRDYRYQRRSTEGRPEHYRSAVEAVLKTNQIIE